MLETGARLGVFEILGPLGAGGMGQVYRAHDKRLGREVAIKVLPEEFSSDPVRVGRFEREARMLASLNHPAIAAIYGAEQAGEIRYIVLELVPGDTLAEWMARGALSLDESLSFARQIAEALEAAHARGVVHRDLKPSNIKVTPEGKIKVLDLGLAKMMEDRSDQTDRSESPTIPMQDHTRPGVILGTVEFMSPEQARGKPVDTRTDIWAFGCILFEMLSGQRTFSGETTSDILAAILTTEPSWEALPPYTPARIRHLLTRCLEKDPNQRLRDIGDARVEIEQVLSHPTEAIPVPLRRSPRKRILAAALSLAAAGAIVSFLLLQGRTAPSAPPLGERALVVLPAKVLSEFPGGQLLGDGLVETLSVRLNQVPGIQVVTPSAAVAASDKNADPFGAANSVGAHLVVRSSVVRNGDRVRIIYSIWNVKTRYQVAGGTVDGSAADLFGMQDRLADHVAVALKLPRPAKKTSTPIGLQTASEQERYVQALGLLQRYDKPASIDGAIAALESLSRERPEAALIAAALGRAYLYKFNLTREKQWAESASDAVARARKLAPELPEVDATLGELSIRTGKPQDAVAAFQRALSAQPDNFDALVGLARAYDATGDGRDAEATYRRAIRLQPSYWAGYSKLGGFYYGNGQIQKAAEMFQRATELAPDNARAFSNLGAARQAMSDFEGALRAEKRSLALDPTDLAYSNLGTIQFYLGHYRESSEAFEKAAALTPGHYLTWANLGDAYRWTKGLESKAPAAYDRAIALCSVELRVNPKDAVVRSYLALCLAKRGKLAEANENAQVALSSEPQAPEVPYNAAVVANLARNTAQAIDRLRQAAESGYSQAMIARDPELSNLHGQKGFEEILESKSRRP